MALARAQACRDPASHPPQPAQDGHSEGPRQQASLEAVALLCPSLWECLTWKEPASCPHGGSFANTLSPHLGPQPVTL